MKRLADIRGGWRRQASLLLLAILLVAFGRTLAELFRFARSAELYSHIILIPFVSGYFWWLKRGIGTADGPSGTKISIGFLAAGLLVLAAYIIYSPRGEPLENELAWKTSAFILLLIGVLSLGSSRPSLRRNAFPLAFLVFMIPLPVSTTLAIEHVLQRNSAAAAAGFFHLGGMSIFRDGTYFQLPGFSLNVAPECSGIHSTIALFITSVAAGYLCLRSPWHRFFLAAAVLPLAILRNGFRVFVIGELCVRVGPEMIDSYIHHHGGPIFFALSLLPFAALLLWLIRAEGGRTALRGGS